MEQQTLTETRVADAPPVPGSAAAGSQNRLLIVLALSAAFLAVEVVGALATNSLALLADAAHLLTDVFGLALTLAAIQFTRRPATPANTYGFYRSEILAALVNSAVLLGIAVYLLYQAWQRLWQPLEIHSLPMLAVALAGLAVNLVGVVLLHGGSQKSLLVRGAFLEVLSDLLASLGVLIAALVILLTGWTQADLLVSLLIGVLVVPRAWKLLTSALDVLLEATPRHLDLAEVDAAMRAIPGVTAVHDLHAWTITSGYVAMSAHVEAAGRRPDEVLHDLQDLLRTRFGIEHATLQVEAPDHSGDGACCVLDPRCLAVGGASRGSG